MKRLHVLVMLIMACFWVLSGSVQAKLTPVDGDDTWNIGNLVWNDLNKNGVQDPGEPGIPDVHVYLYACGQLTDPVSTSDLLKANNGMMPTPIAETTTDLHGNYSFGNLPAGAYVVRVEVKDGWAVSPMFQGTSDENDSDIFPYLFHSGMIFLGDDQTSNYRLGLDAGLFEIQDCDMVTIGDMVFNDCNHNGVQDSDEKGIAGVIVKLFACDVKPGPNVVSIYTDRDHLIFGCGVHVATAVTDLNGNYKFDNVLPGQYCVEVCLPEGYRLVLRPGCPTECNPELPENHTGCMMFNACTANMDIDFAVCHDDCDLAGLGDLVWKDDSNKDGIQNMGETGFPGVKVTLWEYCYCWGQRPPEGDVVHSTDAAPCSLKVASLVTDANGKYLFPNLLPGYYKIVVDAPFGYSASPMDQFVEGVPDDPNGMELPYDSDINPASFASKWIHIEGVNIKVDAGLYFDCSLVGNIKGFVWKDADEDGVPDMREPGMAGVTLKLFLCGSDDCNNQICGDIMVASTKTDDDGFYSFKKLDPSKTYCVKIDLPSCYLLTQQIEVMENDGPTADCVDYYSDFDPGTMHTDCVTLTAGCNVFTQLDAGLIYKVPVPGTIGDFVFEDANQNGIQDCGENGICGVTVELHACDGGAKVASTTTDANGKYLFTNVPANTAYFVKFILPGQYQFTAQDAGDDDAVDSDPCPDNGITANFTLGDGQSTILIDAGMVRATCASLSNFAWEDKNENKQMDANEGVAGVIVELYRCSTNALVQTVTTGADGRFTFSNILADSYYFTVKAPEHYVVLRQSEGGDDGVNADSQTCFDVIKDATSIGLPIALEYTVGVESRMGIPTAFELKQNFPNPFNPSTTIYYDIPSAGQYTMKVYNMLGQEVATLLDGELSAGYHQVVFDASKLTSGVYIYRLTGANVVMTKKMMLNK